MSDLSGVLMLTSAYSCFPLPTRDSAFVTDMLGHSKSNFSPFSHCLSAVSKVTTPESNHLAWHFDIVLIRC